MFEKYLRNRDIYTGTGSERSARVVWQSEETQISRPIGVEGLARNGFPGFSHWGRPLLNVKVVRAGWKYCIYLKDNSSKIFT